MTDQRTKNAAAPPTAELCLFRGIWRCLAMCFALVVAAGCQHRDIGRPTTESPRAASRNLMVVPDQEAIDTASGILAAGGTAVDAAAAVGLTLAVTLPSRAGLGGGGACLVRDAETRVVTRFDFPARPASPTIDARWRAASPHLARGLYALHANGGRLPWRRIVAPAETLARSGFDVSPLLAADIAAHQSTLANDRVARAMVSHSDWRAARRGDRLVNRDLAITLGRIRGRGPGEFYEGAQAKDVADAADAAGVSIFIDDLRDAIPRWSEVGSDAVGSLAISRIGSPNSGAADASTAFVITDRRGTTVACALTMNAPFGLGIAARGLGFLFAAAVDDPFEPSLVIAANEPDGTLALAAAVSGPDATAMTDTILAAAQSRGVDDAALARPGIAHALMSCGTGLAGRDPACFLHGGPAETGR